MLELMKSRRSIRKFTSEPVCAEARDRLVKAALLAPSSKGSRATELIVIDDTATIRALPACKSFGTLALDTATLVLAVIADTEKSDVWPEDCAIVCTHILLETEQLGLGACWVQMRGREGQDGSSEDMVRERLGIPARYGVVALMAIGHKDEQRPSYGDDVYDFSRVHEGSF